jgi:hypothetical protein
MTGLGRLWVTIKLIEERQTFRDAAIDNARSHDKHIGMAVQILQESSSHLYCPPHDDIAPGLVVQRQPVNCLIFGMLGFTY